MEPEIPEDKSFAEVEHKLDYLRSIEERLSSLIDKREGSDEVQVFHVGSEGQIPVDEALKMFEGKRMLDAKKAENGDVVWWVSKSGSRGYFAILNNNPQTSSLEGSVKIISKDGEANEYPKVQFQGGGLQMIKEGQFVEGMPLHFQIPPKKDPKNLLGTVSDEEFKADYLPRSLRTSSVVDMGQIKAEKLSPDNQNNSV